MTKPTAININDLTKGSEIVARFELSRPRMREFDVWPVGSIQLLRLDGKTANFAAILYGPTPAKTEILGFSDDLGKIIQACSDVASREAERDADGTIRLVTGAEMKKRFADIAPKVDPIELTPAQIACARTFANGDFAHLVELAQSSEREYQRELDGCGDSLFRFLMRELDPREDCDTGEEAINRLDNAARDILEVKFAVEEIPTPKL